jgi:hypothetical protein
MKCFNGFAGNEAKRLHFITPILVWICSQFDDIQIFVEEDLNGETLRAHGHFEFMLKRGEKAICLVEAKKSDLEQGMAQDLIGCEVASEVGGLNKVYGIVTDYEHWIFFRSLDTKVEMDRTVLIQRGGIPLSDSIKMVSGKINAMLAEDV